MPLDATARTIELPANGWMPRPDQMPLWRYLQNGGRYACEIAHRRWGKDEVALHHTCIAAHERRAAYWHMLPEAAQARKAIWTAVNPRTGRRRIDEAFPMELRAVTREQEMFIGFKNGSTWQVVGSDNYNSLVGSSVAGVVMSEWALAMPSAWAYLSPILRENGGWALFITTPRGDNHARATYESYRDDPACFAELLTASDTPVFTPETLAIERRSLIDLYGDDMGNALFEQEYNCSFNAAILGAYWGAEIDAADRDGRITDLAVDPRLPVHTAWDIGRRDATVVWFYQTDGRNLRVVDCYAAHGQDARHYVEMVQARGYKQGTAWLPHDARVTEWTAQRTRLETLLAMGLNARIVPEHKLMDGINSARAVIRQASFDRTRCKDGLAALRAYQKVWDEKMQRFSDAPLHNWASDYADAFRYLAVSWKEQVAAKAPPPRPILSVGDANTTTLRDFDRRFQGRLGR